MAKLPKVPTQFARQLGVRPGMAVAVTGAAKGFAEALAVGLPEGARFDTLPNSAIIVYWPQHMVDMMAAIQGRLASEVPLTAFWVVIPKKPVALKRGSDLYFQPILDAVLPTGLVDNKTLTFSDEEYGIRFVPRRNGKLSLGGRGQ